MPSISTPTTGSTQNVIAKPEVLADFSVEELVRLEQRATVGEEELRELERLADEAEEQRDTGDDGRA